MIRTPIAFLVVGLCIFIACLNFKPSDPYLTQYLECKETTENDYCSQYSDMGSCSSHTPCLWLLENASCVATPCADLTSSQCGDDDYYYCHSSDGACKEDKCYKDFTEDEVNDEIYPWSTYAYLPFLLILGPFAEIYSYRIAILLGICGRVVTRFLLLYGNTLLEMQAMQVSYALGSAAEDVFTAYIFYVVPPERYQSATSYVRATALLACLLSGVLGDLLVVLGGLSLQVLMWISAAFVCLGFGVGLFVLRASSHKHLFHARRQSEHHSHHRHGHSGSEREGESGGVNTTDSDQLVTGNENEADVLASHVSPTSNNTKRNSAGSGAGGARSGSSLTPQHSFAKGKSFNASMKSSPFDHSRSFYGGSFVGGHSASKSNSGKSNSGRNEHNTPSNSGKSKSYKSNANNSVNAKGSLLGHASSSRKGRDSFSSAESSQEEEGGEGEEEEEAVTNVYLRNIKASLFRRTGGGGAGGDSRGSSFSHLSGRVMSTLEVFAQQLRYLGVALQNASLLAMILLWVCGNAVYTVLYNYEVSVYEELHGSNAWNGSVLAGMLLAGGLGALLPAWLRHDRVATREDGGAGGGSGAGGGVGVGAVFVSDSDLERSAFGGDEGGSGAGAQQAGVVPVTELTLAVRLSVACVIACAALLLFVGAWRTIPSVACLAVFFGAWQYVNVTVYARLALQLKRAQIAYSRYLGVGGSGVGDSKGGSFVSGSVTPQQQHQQQRLLQQGSARSAPAALQSPTPASGGLLSGGLPSRESPALRTRSSEQFDMVDTFHDVFVPPAPVGHAASNIFDVHGSGGAATAPPDIKVDKDLPTVTGDVRSPLTPPSFDAPLDCNPLTAPLNSGTDIPEPPYSIAVVSIIAMNVVVQVVLQVVLFSWLQLSLRAACTYLVFVFCGATACYVLFTVARWLFGGRVVVEGDTTIYNRLLSSGE